MAMVPSKFEQVELNVFEPGDCSPEIDEESFGLAIAAPSKLSLTTPPRFPVCGAYRVGAPFVNRFQSMSNELVVVAVDAATHKPHACNLLRENTEPARERFDESREGWETTIVEGWFNVDLFRWVAELPQRPAKYFVYATIGDVVSNVCAVEVATP